MYLMFGDEADAEQGRKQKFFVCGAVFINAQQVEHLHDGIQKIRTKFGYAHTDSLKFSGCPRDVSYNEHREVKKQVVKLGRKHNVVFCAYVISHAIAKRNELVPFGINTLLGRFDEFLKRQGDVGVVLMDRPPSQLSNPFKYLKDKFQIGLDFPSGGKRRVENIIGYAFTCDGASNLASMADILLGSFRHCVNEPDKDIANAAIFPTLVRVMWYHKAEDGKKNLQEYGLTLRPKTVKVEKHKKDYADLVARLNGYLKQKEND
jgi:hypothetical protein